MSEILFKENGPLYSVTEQKIAKLRETLKNDKLTPWFWFNSRGVNVTDFYGKTIHMEGPYGPSQAMVFWEFIKPFLVDAIVKTLDETLETCRVRGLKPEEPYIRETAMLLDGHLIDPIYRYMAEIDRRIRGNGNPKNVRRENVIDKIDEMVKVLDKCKDEMIQGLKETNLANGRKEPTEAEAKKRSTISFTDGNGKKISIELISLDSTNPIINKKLRELLDKNLAFLHTPVCPFKAGYLQKIYLDRNAYDNAIEKFGIQMLSTDEKNLLSRALGQDWHIDNLRLFLAQKCNIQNPDDLSYKGILNAIRMNQKPFEILVDGDKREREAELQVKQKENRFEILEKYKTLEDYFLALDEFKRNPSNKKDGIVLTNPIFCFMDAVDWECGAIINQLKLVLDFVKRKRAGEKTIDDAMINNLLGQANQRISYLVKKIKRGCWGFKWDLLSEIRKTLSSLSSSVFPKTMRSPLNYVPEEFDLIEKDLKRLNDVLVQHIEFKETFSGRLKKMPFEQAVEILKQNSLAGGGRVEKKTGFKFSKGQIHYNGKEISISMGRQYEILKKLAEKTGEVISYSELDSQSVASASEQLRTDISEIKKSLKKAKVPFTINSKRTEGYILTSK